MLINVPEQSYSAVFIAFVDRAQVAFRLNGSRAVAHHMRLDSGETLVDLDFDPLPRGIHRLTLIVVDDDLGAGLFGYHDIAADIYVGAAPTRRPPPDPPPPTTRVEPQLQDYALWLTRDSERLQLVGTVTWPATTEVVVTISGSAREGEQVVLVALLQDFVTDRPAQPVRAMPGRVTVWRTALHAPKRTMESVRAVMLTNAWSDITSSGRSVRALLTQKAVLQRE